MNAFCLAKPIPCEGLKTWIRQFEIGRKRRSRKKGTAQFIPLIPDVSLPLRRPLAEYMLPDNSSSGYSSTSGES